MVLGIVWLGWLGSILAVIFGHVALSQIKRSYGALGGRGMAIAGLVLGYIGIATLVAVIVAAVIVGPTHASAAECDLDHVHLQVAERLYFDQNGHYTSEAGLVAAGDIDEESDLHDIELVGSASNASDYSVVATDRCD
jgi:hypothetical protein